MKKYYRLFVAENLWDGEGWSVNDFYEQPFILAIPEEATGKDILSALKAEDLLRKRLRYEVEGAWSDDLFIYYLTDFQCVLNLRVIQEEDMEREIGYKYGIMGQPTLAINVKAKRVVN